ncbi:MAG: C1 family peptidase [Saprospiraceae bacterium]
MLNSPSQSWTNEASNNRIDSYHNFQLEYDQRKTVEEPTTRLWPLSIELFRTGAVTVLFANQILDRTNSGGHAMTIVGYDDGKNAFRIVNSWGTNWGDNGFAWVDYSLMTNPSFCKYVFVAYNTAGGVTPTVNPSNNSTSLPDLVVTELSDEDDEDEYDPIYRKIIYDVKNIGNKSISSSKDWSVTYLYYNAFDAKDYEILIHQYITNDFGGPNTNGYYEDGYGYSSNWWYNENLPVQGELADEMFDGDYRIAWNYDMPEVTGYYYLVMIVDTFDDVEEGNEGNNIFFITAEDGGPIRFEDGKGYGFSSGGVDDRSAANAYPNAYRPEEIRQFIQHLKATGELKAATESVRPVAAEAVRD